MEVTVEDDFGVGLVVCVGVNVSHVAGEGLAADGEVGGVEHMDGAGLKSGLDFGDLVGGAGSCGSLIDLGQDDGTGCKSAGPVGGDGLAICNSVDDELIVGSPVDSGGDDEGVGASGDGEPL